jgi:hypothetical protein
MQPDLQAEMARAICSAAAQEVIAPDMTDGLNWP